MSKKCIKCNIAKEEQLFYKGRNDCIECRKKYNQEYHKRKRDEKRLLKKDKLESIDKNNKKCIKCNIIKNINQFYVNRNYCIECSKKYCKSYKQRNKEKISKYNKIYKEKNKESIKVYNKNYNINNRNAIQERQNKYQKERRTNDPSFKIASALRNRMNKVINGIRKKSSLQLLGCSYDFLIKWLTYLFHSGMTLDNYGDIWHVDHVIPCSKFDLTNNKEQMKCFHWSNLQPLIGKDNLTKGNKTSICEIMRHSIYLNMFLTKSFNENETYNLLEYDKYEYIL